MNLDQLAVFPEASLFSLQLCDNFFTNASSIKEHADFLITSSLSKEKQTSHVMVLGQKKKKSN
jgi:hypothetical protein